MPSLFPRSWIAMPGVGIKTASEILMSIGDCSDFDSAAHLAPSCGHRTDDPQVRTIHQGRVSGPGRQQAPEKRDVPQRLGRINLP